MARSEWFRLIVAAAIAAHVSASAAHAAEAFMNTGSRTSQPVGHYEFCLREPEECRRKSPGRAPFVLTRQAWDLIVEINNRVNMMVEPRTDMEMWGQEEYWAYPATGGDCEDFALEKRRLLIEAGFPAGDLLLTVARQPNGDGHAVLTVRTRSGDFILDNLVPRVLAWTDTEYSYLKRQSERNSGVWVSVEDSRFSAAVGSVK